MTRRILLLVLLSFGYQTLRAQDVSGCSYLFEDAKEAYAAGMVELIPALLLPCLGPDGLTGANRREAFKLVINSYIFDHLPQDADNLMSRFLDEYPNYRAGSTDPAEFVQLLNNQLLSRGIDPDDLDVVAMEGDTATARPRRVKRERVLGVSGNSLGFIAGFNASLPQVVERYSVGNPGLDDGHFGIKPGFQLGATLNYVLNEHFDISAGLVFNHTRFKYSASPVSSISYEYTEGGNYLQLPISVIYKWNPESQGLSYYARGGLVPGYLMSASGSGIRRTDQSGSEVSVDPLDISGSRKSFNVSLMAGAGLRYPLNRSFFYAEARIVSNLLLSNRASERYQNNDLNWLIYHVDSDFRIHQFMICAGICWDISNKEDL